MAASAHISSLFLLFLLLSSLLLGTMAADEASPETTTNGNGAGKSDGAAVLTGVKEEDGHVINICKLTGPFRIQFFGVVIECPKPGSTIENRNLDGRHTPPISGGRVPEVIKGQDPIIHQPPISSGAKTVPEEKSKGRTDAAADDDKSEL